MKKLLALLVVLAMSISVLASCNNGGTDTDDNSENNSKPKTPVITHELTDAQFTAFMTVKFSGAADKLLGDNAGDWKATRTTTDTGTYEKAENDEEPENYSFTNKYAVTKDGNTYKKEDEVGEEQKTWELDSYVVVSKGDNSYSYKKYNLNNENKLYLQNKNENADLNRVMNELFNFDVEDDMTSEITMYFTMLNITKDDWEFKNDVYSLSLKEPKEIEEGMTLTIESAEIKFTVTDGVVRVDYAKFTATTNVQGMKMISDMGVEFTYTGNTVKAVFETVTKTETEGENGEKVEAVMYKHKNEAVYTVDNSGRVVKIVKKYYEWEEKDDAEGEYVQDGGVYTTEIEYTGDKVSKLTYLSEYSNSTYKNEVVFTYGEQTIELPEIVEEESGDNNENHNIYPEFNDTFDGNELPKQNVQE